MILGQILMFTGIVLISSIIFSLLGFVFGSVMYSVPFKEMFQLQSMTPAMVKAQKVGEIFAELGTFMLPAYVISRFYSKKPVRFMGLTKSSAWWIFILVVLIYVAFYPFLDWMTYFNQQMQLPHGLAELQKWMAAQEDLRKKLTDLFLKMPTTSSMLANVLILAVLPAIAEEIFFRGTMQNIFIRWTRNPHVAIFLSGFLFSFMHFQFFGFLPRMALGVLFGYFFYWTGSLWASISVHFLNNLLVIVFSYLHQHGSISGNMDSPEIFPWFLIILSIFLTGALLLYLYRTYRDQKEGNEVYVTVDENEDESPEPDEKWVKVYGISQAYKAEILVGVLENYGIKGLILNKKDSSYQFGEVEVYVHEKDAEEARKVIEENEL